MLEVIPTPQRPWLFEPCSQHKFGKTHYSPALIWTGGKRYYIGCTTSNNIGEWHKSAWTQWKSYEKDCPVILVLGGKGFLTSLTDWCPQDHFYSSSLSLMSCQRYSELDPVGWLWCLVWNRAGCSAKVSPQVIACRNWSWCWCCNRSRRIQI